MEFEPDMSKENMNTLRKNKTIESFKVQMVAYLIL